MSRPKTYDNPTMGNSCVSESYLSRCSKECENCLSICCLLPLTGMFQMYETEEEKKTNKKTIKENKRFFRREFVIIYDMEGFNEEEELRICPLAINGKCLIYDDKPFICQLFTICVWRSKYVAGERE